MTDTLEPTGTNPSGDDPSAVIEAPPKPELSAAGRVAAGLSVKGVGVDPDGEAGVSYPALRLAALVGTLVLVGFLNPWMLVVIVAILVMITLHEFGHYYMAKRAGMKVTEFFLGFGPRIWSTRRGETEYGIKAIPAGAYVKLIGMTNLDEVDPADEPRTYRQKTFWQRIGVAVAGSAMHFMLAVVLIFVALVAIGQPAGSIDPRVQARHWQISDVAPGTGADAAGLRKGDRIVSVNGKTLETFDDLRPATRNLADKTVPLVYERDGKERTTSITIRPFYNWYVDKVVPGSKLADSHLAANDRITAINGEPTLHLGIKELDAKLKALQGSEATLRYEHKRRNGDVVGIEEKVVVDRLLMGGVRGYVGVGEDAPDVDRVNPLKGLIEAPKQFGTVTNYSLAALGKFFTPGGLKDFFGQVGNAQDDRKEAETGKAPTRTRSTAFADDGSGGATGENRLLSIYGLVRVGSSVGAVDPGALISLFALINIFIGVFNLVPLLPFDGGHVVIAIYERIQEKRLNRRRYFVDAGRLLPIVYAVVLVLGMLFVSTIYLDIANPLVR